MSDGLTVLLNQSSSAEYSNVLREAGVTLGSLQATLDDEGRPALLAALKSFGVTSLAARQKIANAYANYKMLEQL